MILVASSTTEKEANTSLLIPSGSVRYPSRYRHLVGVPTLTHSQSLIYLATRGLLVTDHVILSHGQVTWMTPELALPSPNYYTNRRTFQLSTDLTCIAGLHGGSFSGTGLEPVTKQATVRYLYHLATAAVPIRFSIGLRSADYACLLSKTFFRRPTGIVVSEADCSAIGTGFESRQRHGCVLPQNWGGNEPNRTVACMELKATANNRSHLPFAMMNLVGLDLALTDQVALVTTTDLLPQKPRNSSNDKNHTPKHNIASTSLKSGGNADGDHTFILFSSYLHSTIYMVQ
ncbi:hypothetical protein TNCV_4481411 [Trichonephila clavipes]|nr:hypothetical protein TNCV_4481411 [Trichonephila clavipes]